MFKGGGIMNSKEFIFTLLTEKVKSYVYPTLKDSIEIKPTLLGTKAGVIGSSLLIDSI